MNARRCIVYFAFLTCSVLFYTCKKDVTDPEPVTEPATIKEQIIGKWNLDREYTLDFNVTIDTVGDTTYNYVEEIDSSYSNSFLYFYSDSSILIDRHSGVVATGTWYPMPGDFDQTHLFFSIDYFYPPSSIYHILTLSSNKLVLEVFSTNISINSLNGSKNTYKDVHTLEMSK